MRTVTVKIMTEKAYDLLKDLEALNLIRLEDENTPKYDGAAFIAEFKGAMSKTSQAEIDEQFNNIRYGWG